MDCLDFTVQGKTPSMQKQTHTHTHTYANTYTLVAH